MHTDCISIVNFTFQTEHRRQRTGQLAVLFLARDVPDDVFGRTVTSRSRPNTAGSELDNWQFCFLQGMYLMMFSDGRSTAYHRGGPVSIPGQLMQAFRWLKCIAGFPVNTSVFLCKESFHQSTILIH